MLLNFYGKQLTPVYKFNTITLSTKRSLSTTLALRSGEAKDSTSMDLIGNVDKLLKNRMSILESLNSTKKDLLEKKDDETLTNFARVFLGANYFRIESIKQVNQQLSNYNYINEADKDKIYRNQYFLSEKQEKLMDTLAKLNENSPNFELSYLDTQIKMSQEILKKVELTQTIMFDAAKREEEKGNFNIDRISAMMVENGRERENLKEARKFFISKCNELLGIKDKTENLESKQENVIESKKENTEKLGSKTSQENTDSTRDSSAKPVKDGNAEPIKDSNTEPIKGNTVEVEKEQGSPIDFVVEMLELEMPSYMDPEDG